MQVIGCKYGQALVVNQIGIFVEGGTGTSKFTTEEDKHLVIYCKLFSLNNDKWKKIAMYMAK